MIEQKFIQIENPSKKARTYTLYSNREQIILGKNDKEADHLSGLKQ